MPAGPDRVYVKVEFDSFFEFIDLGPGAINILWYPTGDETEDVEEQIVEKEAEEREGSGILFGESTLKPAKAGSKVWIEVDNDTFASQSPIVRLTFFSGADATGDIIAVGSVQLEDKPRTPGSGSATVAASADTVTLRWNRGSGGGGGTPNPDHYRVEIAGTTWGSGTVDDTGQSQPTLVISNSRSQLGVGNHTAEVRHCNAAGGCSGSLNITFAVPAAPPPVLPPVPPPVLPPVLPPTPSNLSSKVSEGTIALTWNAVPNVEYVVYQWKGASGGGPGQGAWKLLPFDSFTINPAPPIRQSSVTIGGLTNGVMYSHQVTTKDNAGESAPARIDTTLPDKLATPTLDVLPLPNRRAELVWTVLNATANTTYQIESRIKTFNRVSTHSKQVTVIPGVAPPSPPNPPPVSTASVQISDLTPEIVHGENTFTIAATGLSADTPYRISMTTDSDFLGFNSDCSDRVDRRFEQETSDFSVTLRGLPIFAWWARNRKSNG